MVTKKIVILFSVGRIGKMPLTWFSRLDENSKERSQTEIADIQKIIKEMQAELKKPTTVLPCILCSTLRR